jgi:hypothetical protein
MNETTKATHDQQVFITDNGHTVASADVSTPAQPHGTTRVALHAASGHLPTGARAHLVDVVVLDLPEVQLSDHLQAYAPIGDTESMSRIRQRTTDMRTHAAAALRSSTLT